MLEERRRFLRAEVEINRGYDPQFDFEVKAHLVEIATLNKILNYGNTDKHTDSINWT